MGEHGGLGRIHRQASGPDRACHQLEKQSKKIKTADLIATSIARAYCGETDLR
jgi:hypothetical protein